MPGIRSQKKSIHTFSYPEIPLLSLSHLNKVDGLELKQKKMMVYSLKVASVCTIQKVLLTNGRVFFIHAKLQLSLVKQRSAVQKLRIKKVRGEL